MGYSSVLLLTTALLFTLSELTSGSGSTDSAAIRAIESEIRRVKSTSDSIVTELRTQKVATTSLQNDFKWLHSELKVFKKALADIDLLLNKTNNDTQFIRDKVSDIGHMLQKMVTPVKAMNTTATTPSPVANTKKFILF